MDRIRGHSSVTCNADGVGGGCQIFWKGVRKFYLRYEGGGGGGWGSNFQKKALRNT